MVEPGPRLEPLALVAVRHAIAAAHRGVDAAACFRRGDACPQGPLAAGRQIAGQPFWAGVVHAAGIASVAPTLMGSGRCGGEPLAIVGEVAAFAPTHRSKHPGAGRHRRHAAADGVIAAAEQVADPPVSALGAGGPGPALRGGLGHRGHGLRVVGAVEGRRNVGAALRCVRGVGSPLAFAFALFADSGLLLPLVFGLALVGELGGHLGAVARALRIVRRLLAGGEVAGAQRQGADQDRRGPANCPKNHPTFVRRLPGSVNLARARAAARRSTGPGGTMGS